MKVRPLSKRDTDSFWELMPGFSQALVLGWYRGGFAQNPQPGQSAYGLLWPDTLVVVRWSGTEIGRIPIAAITDVACGPSEEIEKMDLARALLVGVFAIGWKRRVSTAQIVIAYRDDIRQRDAAVLFDFGELGWGWASQSADSLHGARRALIPPTPAMPAQSSEKVCPFCAETIKKAAVVCRYCGRDLPG